MFALYRKDSNYIGFYLSLFFCVQESYIEGNVIFIAKNDGIMWKRAYKSPGKMWKQIIIEQKRKCCFFYCSKYYYWVARNRKIPEEGWGNSKNKRPFRRFLGWHIGTAPAASMTSYRYSLRHHHRSLNVILYLLNRKYCRKLRKRLYGYNLFRTFHSLTGPT